MNGKERLLITLGIIGIIAAALFTSVGRNLLYLNIPSIVLPDVSSSQDAQSSQADWQGEQAYLLPVTVTVDSVQSVVSALQRADSYFQSLTVELFWTDGSSTTEVSVWRNGSWIATQQMLPSGLVLHNLVGERTLYYWYAGSDQWLSTPVSLNSSDLSQRIPTYEDVIALDIGSITDANYTLYGEIPTIYVETAVEDRVQRYWVSTQSGLLVAAEVEEAGALIYRLIADGELQIPCPSTEPFALPDGTAISELT